MFPNDIEPGGARGLRGRVRQVGSAVHSTSLTRPLPGQPGDEEGGPHSTSPLYGGQGGLPSGMVLNIVSSSTVNLFPSRARGIGVRVRLGGLPVQ